MMKAFLLFLVLLAVGPSVVHGQSIPDLIQCGNLGSGVCRLRCLNNELSVFPYTCSYYSAYFRVVYQRCVTSMPCCYWTGSCQRSCSYGQVQLGRPATCGNAADVCCIPGGVVVPPTTVAPPSTTAATHSSVAERQGACGGAVTVTGRWTSATFRRPSLVLKPGARIIGGTVTGATDWPWMVRIVFTSTTGFCAGVLVDGDTVLTVAHCLAGVDKNSMQVILADHSLSTFDTDEEVMNIADYYIVSSFLRGRRGDDFGIIKLARNVTFTDRKLPACLPDPTFPLVSPPSCYIAGWGVTEQGVGGPLRAANVQLLDSATCERRLSAAGQGTVTVPRDMICTNNPPNSPTDGCLFDDGDMLVCRDTHGRWSLIGIMSEYSCGRALPILFTDVRNYTDVILDRL